MNTFTYHSNNSGGHWWLTDENWKSLEKEGWKVEWKPERWLGALATQAAKEFESKEDAVEDFERITGEDYHALGCSCCGSPHSIWED